MRGVHFSTLRAEPSAMAGSWCQCSLVLVFLVSSTVSSSPPSLHRSPYSSPRHAAGHPRPACIPRPLPLIPPSPTATHVASPRPQTRCSATSTAAALRSPRDHLLWLALCAPARLSQPSAPRRCVVLRLCDAPLERETGVAAKGRQQPDRISASGRRACALVPRADRGLNRLYLPRPPFLISSVSQHGPLR